MDKMRLIGIELLVLNFYTLVNMYKYIYMCIYMYVYIIEGVGAQVAKCG